MIITGALQTIYPGRKTGTGRINLYDDGGIPKLKEWVKAIHDNGSTATGAGFYIPDLPGVNGPNVVTAIDVLAGRKQTGRNVVVVGGGPTGCETAGLLARKGKQVAILREAMESGFKIALQI